MIEKCTLFINKYFFPRSGSIAQTVYSPGCKSISQLTNDEFHLLPIRLMNTWTDEYAKNKFL